MLREGWVCPKCQRVWSPVFIGPCDCVKPKRPYTKKRSVPYDSLPQVDALTGEVL